MDELFRSSGLENDFVASEHVLITAPVSWYSRWRGVTFLLHLGLNILFIIFFVIFVPETKGGSLEKIEANLLSGLPLKEIGRTGARIVAGLTPERSH
jgi:hypothetical protein